MSAAKLLNGEYEPFLCYPSYSSIIPRIGHAGRFKCKYREKGLAVSVDGRVFRMKLCGHGYNDKFIVEDGQCVLSYVCGTMEEQRRQNLNRRGGSVLVEIGDKNDRHGVLRGIFKRIEAMPDPKPDGTELLTARSFIAIIGYESKDGGVVEFDQQICVPRPAKKARLTHCEHLVIDTESAAPLNQRLLGRRHDPFPILEFAYYRTGHDFDYVYKMRSARLSYNETLLDRLGNDERSSVLKYPVEELREKGEDASCVLADLFHEIRRVTESGGFVFAHNVNHDIGQIRATCRLIGHSGDGVRVRAIDTVKTAGNFVEGVEDGKWMKLVDIARLCSLSTTGAINGRLHCAADDALLLLQVLRSRFPPDQLDAFVEEYTI